MQSTNWKAATVFQNQYPHTYTSMEHLIMAMADAEKNKNKTSLFGVDKGLKSYKKFEEKLKETLLAMVLDGLIERSARADEFREKLGNMIYIWSEIFPNWQDAYSFAVNNIAKDSARGNKLISALIGVK